MQPINLNEKFEVFYDGLCPLCLKEINMLKRLDRHDRIVFTDIASEGFDAAVHVGLPFDTLMDEIHGRMANGDIVIGVEVFRQLYGRVGLKWAIGLTRTPGIRQTLDWGYRVFARNRLKWTGRCDGETCAVPASDSSS